MKILLAVDGSETSEAAADEVLRRPWPASSVVRVLSAFQHTLPAPVTMGWGGGIAPGLVPGAREVYEQSSAELGRQSEALVRRVAKTLERSGLTIETAVKQGPAGSAIVEEAASWRADLIVVGSRGLSGLKRWLLGSVAQYVVSHAPCSVEVVRPRGPSKDRVS
jgi:nucleotide-binding universal stress UspA family protein